MKGAITESRRRREIQLEYNQKHGITPRSIEKAIFEGIEAVKQAQEIVSEASAESDDERDVRQLIAELEGEMLLAARNLQFERAAYLRDQILELEKHYGKAVSRGK